MNLSGFLGFHIFDDGGIFFWKRSPFKFNDAFFHFASSASFVFCHIFISDKLKIDTNLLLKTFLITNARRKTQNIRLHSYVLGVRFLSYLWRIYKHP